MPRSQVGTEQFSLIVLRFVAVSVIRIELATGALVHAVWLFAETLSIGLQVHYPSVVAAERAETI